jgi:hypothetical protein
MSVHIQNNKTQEVGRTDKATAASLVASGKWKYISKSDYWRAVNKEERIALGTEH